MIGNIYTKQKCAKCNGALVHDEQRSGLFCRKHPEIGATGKFVVRFGRETTICASSYVEAVQILNGLRFKTGEGTFDLRDYKKSAPLGFQNLAAKWLEEKKKEVKPGSFKNLRNYMARACKFWGNLNIKDIGYAEIEDFFIEQMISAIKQKPISSHACIHFGRG